MIRLFVTGGAAGWIVASTLPIFETGDILTGGIGVVLAVAVFLVPHVGGSA